MRIYFLSYMPAILKLNGLFAGTVDGFERHVELTLSDGVFAEIVPGENLQPLNFFINESFLKQPPDFADVYLLEGDALIYIREYAPKDVKLEVIYQTRFCGNLITVFKQGGIYLSAEGTEYSLTPLPPCFLRLTAEIKTLCGREVLALYGGGSLIIINEYGKIIFSNRAESADFGEELTVTSAFETCTAAKAESRYSYDGEKLEFISGRTVETRPPEKQIIHFAFFESVLTRGDFTAYLDEELKPKANALMQYLGEFVSVSVPTEKFYLSHGEICAAGLIYPKAKNLYEVKYFAVDLNGNKISNIYPIE